MGLKYHCGKHLTTILLVVRKAEEETMFYLLN